MRASAVTRPSSAEPLPSELRMRWRWRNLSDIVSYHDNTTSSILSLVAHSSKYWRIRALLSLLPCSHLSRALIRLPPALKLTHIGDGAISFERTVDHRDTGHECEKEILVTKSFAVEPTRSRRLFPWQTRCSPRPATQLFHIVAGQKLPPQLLDSRSPSRTEEAAQSPHIDCNVCAALRQAHQLQSNQHWEGRYSLEHQGRVVVVAKRDKAKLQAQQSRPMRL
jgi:hypothetical protein